jgi:Xaa-Pro aminopeptidase
MLLTLGEDFFKYFRLYFPQGPSPLVFQPNYPFPMRYSAPPKDLFIRNREAFARQMKPRTIAVFHSNDLISLNADANYRFAQDSNMYYLSGIDQEEVILVIFPDAPTAATREMLFIRETNATIQVWEGWKYSKQEARDASGVQTVHFYQDFDAVIRRLVSHFDGVYIDVNEHERNSLTTRKAGHRLAEKFRTEFPAHQIYRSAPILEALRSIKSPEEIEQMKVAMGITEKAFRRVLGFIRPGVMEYEIEAEIQHEFLRNRASGPAYDSIIATGGNACVLHYVDNSSECQDGQLILMDFGSRYANYCSDLTRTVPVNGKFTPRQRDVYEAVLRVMKQATQMLRPGNLLESYHTEVGKLMEAELIGLGLITEEQVANQPADAPAYKKYFMHGTSHFLGLDVHDVGNRYAPFQAGMVFTCEPGIYIPEEGIGIRLENNILITEGDPIDLMASIPLEADEIEALMSAARS